MPRDDWFEAITGFRERSYEETRERLEVADATLRSRVNGRSHGIGRLTTPSLGELRAGVSGLADAAGCLRVSEVVGDAGALHRDAASRHAVFQVASQFNLLEMTGPDVTPEDGVSRYAFDHTQGPACAIAAGAATIYRNYFAPVNGRMGQTTAHQIDCLADLGAALGNEDHTLWTMRNGYALCTEDGLATIDRRLRALDDLGRDALRCLLRVGLHEDVEVTGAGVQEHLVSQVFCSALPVAYSNVPKPRWTTFATVVLEAAYEATLLAAVLNAARTSCHVVYLTRLGGGAFGNDSAWIDAAIHRALDAVRDFSLDVRIVVRRA